MMSENEMRNKLDDFCFEHKIGFGWDKSPQDTIYAFIYNGKCIHYTTRTRTSIYDYSHHYYNIVRMLNTHMQSVDESVNLDNLDGIEKVIFHNPATIVFWKDGTKTVVKCGPGDTFDKKKGLAMAIIKKAYFNKGNYNNLFRKWCK